MDIRVNLPNGVLCIRYGGSSEIEKENLLRSIFLQTAAEKWNNVRDQIMGLGKELNSTILMDEKKRILAGQQVLGLVPQPFHDLHSYPEMASDKDNVIFLKT